MTAESRQVSEHIDRPAAEVYEYASNPANLPEWAAGLGTSVEQADGHWYIQAPGGRIEVAFAPRNEYGVLDHYVTFPSGEVFYNPLRVTSNGNGSEIVFSVRRSPGLSDEEFDRDAHAVARDLARLKQIIESRQR